MIFFTRSTILFCRYIQEIQTGEEKMRSLAESMKNFYSIITKLRSPEGCPWDRKQTADSLKGNLLEEAYECIEAISNNDDEHTREELGDVLLLIGMISRIKEEEGKFTFSEVIDEISEKLIRRHPHVFGDEEIDNADDVKKKWEDIKKNVEKKDKPLLDGISKNMPPLERAYRFQKKASGAGFDWIDTESVWEKVYEELGEFRDETVNSDREKMEEEFGDFLFSIVNIGRFLKIDPAIALHRTNEKFLRRFQYVEKSMKKDNLELGAENFTRMDTYWDEAKELERK